MKVTSILLIIASILALSQASVVSTMLGKLKRYNSRLSRTQLRNAELILTECSKYSSDERRLAYVLSTAIGESNIRPIKEYRARSGYYKRCQDRYWPSGFYGRGFVQLTWDYNYRKFGNYIGVNLIRNPDLAMEPSVAAKIMCYGMYKGKFTGRSLYRYFTRSSSDWVNARRIINGRNKASEFAERAKRIYYA